MREIKFQILFEVHNRDFTTRIASHYTSLNRLTTGDDNFDYSAVKIIAKRQFTGLQDKNGVDIYADDIIQFSDKYEWYRSPLQSKDEIEEILQDHVKYPYERRTVKIPEDYEWLLSSEIQNSWEVIGNIHQNPELINNNV
jgi:uncharacterized phage protein (TIGR01671 family)